MCQKIPDKLYKDGHRQVNVVCPRHEWDNLEIEDSHFKNVKNYKGKTNDHPGNEYLPPVKKMILTKDELHALEDSLMLLSTYNQVKIEKDNSVSCNELHEKSN
ncbi:MAG: hypothetical protein CM15mV15_1940 [uncultured marine virus]|nr:MAG: hypothetical protein CM15mV15_1940 [uncultured marine virus]